ncbi:MAG: ATP-dependent 6-phosphofructokinase [Verrucomicrobium sp.]|nr:ATP-dependent 6-phosphofructokinase [Verrucomicrobium sp.]
MKRFAVLTSGGDSPGMNPAIASVTRTGLNFGLEVVGIQNGYQGIFDEQFVPLDALKVSGKNRDPGTFLQTSRCLEFREEAGQRRAVEVLRRQGIEGLIVIGGDGSLTGAQKLHQLGFPVVGLPGTIDNDIYGTDMGIGVDTALNTIIHLVDMIRATAASHRRCFIVEVMGRDSGYLALMTTISTGSQIAVIPEYKLNAPRILEKLARRFEHNHNNSVIIVAEGVCSGEELMKRLHDAGPIRQEMRLTVLGHVQRGGVPTHFDRLLGSRMGERAVLALTEGQSGVMVAQAQGQMQLRALSDILGKKKPLPADAIRVARNLGTEFGDPFDEA